MSTEQEILDFLFQHLSTIFENDIEAYHTTTSQDLTLYEWWVTPTASMDCPSTIL